MGPTSVFLLNENISLYTSSPDSIINHSITVRLKVNKYHDPANEKNENISKESSITACGVVEMCDNQCQKSLSLEGAEIWYAYNIGHGCATIISILTISIEYYRTLIAATKIAFDCISHISG